MDANSNENRPSALPITSDDIGFGPDEMTACASCGRANAPTRVNCIYCGEAFGASDVDPEKVLLAPRRPEGWEPGFNVVAISFPSVIETAAAAEMAARTGVADAVLCSVASRVSPLPVARVATEVEAEIVRSHLSAGGIESAVVSDRDLGADRTPARCRSIGFSADELTLTDFNSGETVRVARDAVRLIVSGSIRESKTESTKVRKGRKSTVEIQGESVNETLVIDIYADGHAAGLRIPAIGFDFSCLGQEKNYIAAKNAALLLEKLLAFCTAAKVVSNYDADRYLLDLVWDLDERSESPGKRRVGWGRSAIANVAVCSNLTQFTKFSRLQRHLL